MQTLKKLLNSVINTDNIPDITIQGLSLDSREVTKGDLFFAYAGNATDSKQFISAAIAKGAVAIVTDTQNKTTALTFHGNTPIIAMPNLTTKIGNIATQFYDNPSRDMLICGITGTNGKTSTSYLLASALEKLGNKIGLIGTLGYGSPNALTSSVYTTPNPIMLQKILYEFKQQNKNTVIMEVSSHALDQKRFADINISYGTFTNLTHDHLDYHHNMAEYEKAKHKLFELANMQYGIFNLDDPVGLKWLQEFQSKLHAYGYTQNATLASPASQIITAHNIELHLTGVRATITSPWGEGILNSSLLGRFNISNLLAVISNLCLMGYQFEKILEIIPTLQTVPGRMQTIGGNNKPLVVIDFSHTPDALEQALKTLKEHCQGKLICLFGCGGDRDRAKRPEMAEISEQYADNIIITNDNVRFENPQQIVDDIMQGFTNQASVQIEQDRAKAIALAINQAKPGDIVLLAGKGHEPYQIVGEQRLPFSDIDTAKKII